MRERGPAHLDPGGGQALMLPVERQVETELVDEKTGQKAHVGEALLQNRGGSGRTGELLGLLVLVDLAHVAQNHVGAGPLGQTMRLLLTHDAVALCVFLHLGIGDLNHLDRHRRVKAQTAFLATPPTMGLDHCRHRRGFF